MSEHLSSEQLDRLRRSDVGAAELFAWGDHLQVCDECSRAASGDRVLSIDSEENTHLEFDLLHALVEDRADAIDREIADTHLEDCATCRAELADLRLFAKQERTSPWRRWVVAAAAVLALIVTGLVMTPRSTPQVATLDIPPMAVELHAYTRELRGRAHDANALEPMSPIGRIVVEDRPVFEWTAVGRARYVVEIFDEQYRPIATSPRLATTRWTPPQPLPSARVLTWQVTAFDRAGSITAPRPPSAEARFFILDRDRARTIRSLEAQDRPALSLGIAYAESGALAEAQQELSALIAANQEVERARQYLQQVQRASP
jgi:hypothetical protein